MTVPTDMASPLEGFADYVRHELMLSPATIRRYESVVTDFMRFIERQRVAVAAVESDAIVHYLRSKAALESSPSKAMWNQRLSALRTFFAYLIEEDVMLKNPAVPVERRHLPRRERLPLSLDEMLALVEAAREHSPTGQEARNVAILQVFLHCSLRVAEVASLTLPQVDLANRAFVAVRTKGDQRLSVYFNDVVAEALGHWLAVRERLVLPEAEAHLFVSNRGEALRVRSVEYLVGRYAALAGIARRVTPHLLRHSSATEYVELATPLTVVQEQLGHASVATTERYVHLPASERRKAVERFGKAWKQAAEKPRKSAKKPPDGPAAGTS